jgi:precorrin-6B methylase 2
MTQYRAFYTATNPNGSRFEGEMIVEALNAESAKRIAKHYAQLWGKQEVRNIQVIDNT